jgi:hypothetical protein
MSDRLNATGSGVCGPERNAQQYTPDEEHPACLGSHTLLSAKRATVQKRWQ